MAISIDRFELYHIYIHTQRFYVIDQQKVHVFDSVCVRASVCVILFSLA